MRKFYLLVLALFVSSVLFCANGQMEVQAEYVPTELKFLSYCDEEEFAVWDDEIAVLTEEQAAEMKAYIEKEIIKGASTDYEKAHQIYDWIFANVTYTYDDPYLEPYNVFTQKKAVCGGFSNLYKAMLNQVGIPSVLICGNTPYGAHVWNAVYVNGKWIDSDATWGGDYFDKGTEAFRQDHYSQRIEKVRTLVGENVLVGYDNGVAVVGVADGAKSVTIPDTFEDMFITSISYQLFDAEYGIQEVNVGQCIYNIEVVTCETLEAINVSEANEVYASKDGVLFYKGYGSMLLYPMGKKDSSFTLPKETTGFDLKEGFKNEYLVDIYVEEGNPEFSSYEGALYNAAQTELLSVPLGKTKVYVPDNAAIGSVAFANADTSKMTIVANENTPAHQYALANNIAFETLQEEPDEPKEDVTKIFGDVYAGSWYVDAVQYVYDNGIMTGNAGLFSPSQDVTRAILVETLYKMEGKPAVSNFAKYDELKDLTRDAWWKNSIAWGLNVGVATGDTYLKTFSPEANVTREQLATFLYRYANYKGMDTKLSKSADEILAGTFVNIWAKEAFAWAVDAKLITGVETTGANGQVAYDLAPQLGASRAQLAVILQRFCEK